MFVCPLQSVVCMYDYEWEIVRFILSLIQSSLRSGSSRFVQRRVGVPVWWLLSLSYHLWLDVSHLISVLDIKHLWKEMHHEQLVKLSTQHSTCKS